MSATNRGDAERREADHYPTPFWPVHRLLERVHLPDGHWLEPAVGEGNIVRAVNMERAGGIVWMSMDIRPRCLTTSGHVREHITGDYIWMGCPELRGRRFDVVITNPPFSLAHDFVNQAMQHADIVVMLLRLNWLGSEKRRDWLKAHMPDVYVLPNRPQMDPEKDGTDATEYAWFVWGMSSGGHFDILEATPLEVRNEQKEQCRELYMSTLALEMIGGNDGQLDTSECGGDL